MKKDCVLEIFVQVLCIPTWLSPDQAERKRTGIAEVRSCAGTDELQGDFTYLPMSPNTKAQILHCFLCQSPSEKDYLTCESLCTCREATAIYSTALNWSWLPIEPLPDSTVYCRVCSLILNPDRLWLVLQGLIAGWTLTQRKSKVKTKGQFMLLSPTSGAATTSDSSIYTSALMSL